MPSKFKSFECSFKQKEPTGLLELVSDPVRGVEVAREPGVHALKQQAVDRGLPVGAKGVALRKLNFPKDSPKGCASKTMAKLQKVEILPEN